MSSGHLRQIIFWVSGLLLGIGLALISTGLLLDSMVYCIPSVDRCFYPFVVEGTTSKVAGGSLTVLGIVLCVVSLWQGRSGHVPRRIRRAVRTFATGPLCEDCRIPMMRCADGAFSCTGCGKVTGGSA